MSKSSDSGSRTCLEFHPHPKRREKKTGPSSKDRRQNITQVQSVSTSSSRSQGHDRTITQMEFGFAAPDHVAQDDALSHLNEISRIEGSQLPTPYENSTLLGDTTIIGGFTMAASNKTLTESQDSNFYNPILTM